MQETISYIGLLFAVAIVCLDISAVLSDTVIQFIFTRCFNSFSDCLYFLIPIYMEVGSP